MAKSYVMAATKHPDLFRVMDREGNWERYLLVKKWTAAYEAAVAEQENPKAPTFTDVEEGIYLDGVTTILKRGYTKGAFFEQWLTNHTKEERDEIFRAAGERGDKLHRAIDWVLSSAAVDPTKLVLEREMQIYNRETKEDERLENDEWDAMLGWVSFWQAHDPLVLTSEAAVYQTMFGGYAGTIDSILILRRECGVKECRCKGLVGKIGVWDWKSSKGIRASFSAQLAAYAFSENITQYLPAASTIAYIGILRIGSDHKSTGGYEMQVFTQNAESEEEEKPYKNPTMFFAFKRFQGAKDIGDFEHRPFSPSKDIIDIPDEVNLTIARFDFAAAEEEAKKLAAAEQESKPVKNLNIDLARLKVGVWILNGEGSVAQVKQLDDDGTVHSENVANAKEVAHHYTKIKKIYAGEAEALGVGEIPEDAASVRIPPTGSSEATHTKPNTPHGKSKGNRKTAKRNPKAPSGK